jgi:glucokinase
MFSSLPLAVAHYLTSVSERPDLVSLAVAGPASQETVTMTNAAWTFRRDDIVRATGASHVTLINDFQAIALALPYLSRNDLHRVHGGESNDTGCKAVLGPGTGFGVCGLVKTETGWQPIPGEGGHMTFGATNTVETALFGYAAGRFGHVSIERLLSGAGLQMIYAFLSDRSGGEAGKPSPAGIVSRAKEENCPNARGAVELFVALLARVAADVALVFGAHGGVYLGGGIAPRILSFLDTESFRNAFERKGRLSDYVSRIPVNVIVADDAGLRGAAVALRKELGSQRRMANSGA